MAIEEGPDKDGEGGYRKRLSSNLWLVVHRWAPRPTLALGL
jgi:hypothetical protein